MGKGGVTVKIDDLGPIVFARDLPEETEQVAVCAKLWLHTHPGAGPGYDRAHRAATESLAAAVRALNMAEVRHYERALNPGKPK